MAEAGDGTSAVLCVGGPSIVCVFIICWENEYYYAGILYCALADDAVAVWRYINDDSVMMSSVIPYCSHTALLLYCEWLIMWRRHGGSCMGEEGGGRRCVFFCGGGRKLLYYYTHHCDLILS